MTDVAQERDLNQYTGKRVTVVRNLAEPNEDGQGTVEIEGQVQVANELGLLIKPKGQVKFELIPKDEIEDIYMAPEATKKLKASKLKPVTLGSARRHCLERHAVTLEWANSVSEEDALAWHESIDHVGSDLGHIHVSKDEADGGQDEAAEDAAAE